MNYMSNSTEYSPDIPNLQQSQSPETNNDEYIDETTMDEILGGLKNTTTNNLPSRDIPMQTQHYSVDENTIPNAIPTTNKNKFAESNNRYIETQPYNFNTNSINQKTNANTNYLLDELYVPAFIALLYFVFQLPIFKRTIYLNLPNLFLADGNYNMYGYIVISLLFSAFYKVFVTWML